MVIWGHVIQYLQVDFYNNWLYKFIYSFHMPLFMLISGYFSRSSFDKPLAVFIMKKTKQLLIPIISWTILISFYSFLLYHSVDDIKQCLIGGLWFLKTLFIIYIYVYAIKKLNGNDWCLALFSILLAFIIPKASFLCFNWLLLFFWSGFFLRKYQNYIAQYRKYITIISLLIYICIYSQFQNCGYALINIQTIRTENVIILLKFIGSFSASVFIINICYYFCEGLGNGHKIHKISHYGMYTLGLYLTQSFFVEQILRFNTYKLDGNIYIYNFIITPVVTFLEFVLCMLFIKITSKNKVLDILLFGNQY